MTAPNREPPVGIRWGPTLAGAVMLLIGIALTAAATMGSGLALIGIAVGVLLLVIGIILLRIGRRDLTRPLRSRERDR